MSLLLNKEEQGIVVFHFWKSLKYKTRLAICLLMALCGFALQYMALGSVKEFKIIVTGALFIFLGNLLMLVKGYNNKIKLDTYTAESEWVKTDIERLKEIVDINKKAKKWDINSLDITNVLGVFAFVGFIVVLIVLVSSNILESGGAKAILFIDALVLFVPHWLTGVRSITLTPNLLKKISIYLQVMDRFGASLEKHDVDFLTYVKGSKEKFPRDVKMKVDFKDQPEDFLGMYAQITLNNVQETLYPYFYVVLVAKRGSMMNQKFVNSVKLAPKIMKEFKEEGDVEILVLRQVTTKTSGYYTKKEMVMNTFEVGLKNVNLLFGKEVVN